MPTISRRTFIRTMAVGGGTLAYMATALTVHGAGTEAYTLRIVHTNDHHARLEPVTGGTPPAPVHGGVSRRKTLIDAIRAEGGNQLLLDAGDVFQGTLYFNQYRGLADLEFYNALGYQAMAVGNHEFDLGQQPLADFTRGATFPVLSANMQIAGSSPLAGLIKPWTVIWVGGQPIGIVGLTTEDTATISSPGPGITFTPAIDAARLGVATLRGQGVNKILILSHLGIGPDRELARQVDGIAAIIGGHTHTPMGPMLTRPNPNSPYPEVVASPSGKPVIIAHDWEWGRWLGDLTLGFDDQGELTRVVAGRPTEVAASIEPDPGFENRIKVFQAPLNQLRATPVGQSAVDLNGARADVRTRETNFGNLIADGMVAKTRSAGAQIAIMNGGSIRASIPAGTVTLGQVLDAQPFANTLVVLDLTGAQVREALENGVSQVEQTAGRFAQVSGLRYSFDPSQPVGSRVTGVQVGSGSTYAPIDPAATYRVVVSNFIANGGDGYAVMQRGTNRVDVGFVDSDVTAEYIAAGSPVGPQVEGRIVVSGLLPGATGDQAAGGAVPIPAELPRTGGELSPLLVLAALGAGALGSGLRLRERARRMAERRAHAEAEPVEAE